MLPCIGRVAERFGVAVRETLVSRYLWVGSVATVEVECVDFVCNVAGLICELFTHQAKRIAWLAIVNTNAGWLHEFPGLLALVIICPGPEDAWFMRKSVLGNHDTKFDGKFHQSKSWSEEVEHVVAEALVLEEPAGISSLL